MTTTLTVSAMRNGRCAGEVVRRFYALGYRPVLRDPRAQQLREIHRATFKLREYAFKIRHQQRRVSYPQQLRLLPSQPTAPVSRLSTPFQRPSSLSSPFFHETARAFGEVGPPRSSFHHSHQQQRPFHDVSSHLSPKGPGKYGGPTSGVVKPRPGGADPTDIFKEMNVTSDMPPPSGGVDRLFYDGFLLNNGIEIHGAGVLILQNEAFRWTDLERLARVTDGILDCDEELWGALDVVAPKPELLVLGTGAQTLMMSERLRSRIHNLGIRVDAMDTRNAAAEYNLLASERSGENVAAAFFPLSFR